MTIVYVPIHWLHSSAAELEWQQDRLQSDLDEAQISETYRELVEHQLAWLKDRIPYQKTLELITPQS